MRCHHAAGAFIAALCLCLPSQAQELPLPDPKLRTVEIVDAPDGELPPLPGRLQSAPARRSASDLSGTWLLRGDHPRKGGYRGEIQFEPLPDGRWAYEKRLGSELPETGQAELIGRRLFLKEDPSEATGLAKSLAPDDLITYRAPQLSVYMPSRGGASLQGRTWQPGSPWSSSETLTRVGPDAHNNDLQLLIDGPEAFPPIYDAIDSAQSSILLQTFSWFDDAAGERMADKLIAKHQEGVTVRLLIEAFPQMWGWDIGKKLRAAGVPVILHHGLGRGFLNSFKRTFKRTIGRLFGMKPPREKRGFFNHDHRKLIVVDGNVAFTGGMNIGDKYEQGTTWHDVHAKVEGSAVPKLEALFYDRWHAAGGEGEALPAVPGDPWPGDLEVIVEENLPGVTLEVTERYLSEIRGAQRELMIENPYLLYDPVVNALQDKARSGVRTVVILPSNDLNDEALARDAFYWTQNDIVRSGVELYKYRDRMSHGKIAVFDRARMTVGTTNLDMIAMERNAEVNLYVPDEAFALHTIQRVFTPDIAASDRIRVKKLSFWEKVKGFVMHSMRRFL
jgi:cardiolipin synthase